MEDLDARLFIAGVEVSCWQDQLRQAVSIYYLPIFKLFFIDFYLIYSISINISFWFITILIMKSNFYQSKFYFVRVRGDYLTPLQASSVLIKVDRRRASLVPSLPPITKEQILQGELSSLLVEEDYNLSTMVSKFFRNIILSSHRIFQLISTIKSLISF